MKVYAVTIHKPWDGKEIVSIHMTRKAALQVACLEGLGYLLDIDGFEDSDMTWVEDNFYNIDKDNSLTIEQLDGIFNYMEQLLWGVEMEVEILQYTLKP